MPEQPRSIIAGAESEQADVVDRDRRRRRGLRRPTAPPRPSSAAPSRCGRRRDRRRQGSAVEAAVAESRLPEARIAGEVGRTTGQLRMFADVVRRGDHLGVRIDPALPDRTPLPRRRPPPAPHPARPGRRLRGQQLPARLLHRGRRHRLGTGRRMPGSGQGPPRAPPHRLPGGPRRHPRRREAGPARGHVLLPAGAGGARQHRARPGAGRRPAHQGRRLHRVPRRRPGPGRRRSRTAGTDPGVRRDVLDQPGRRPPRRTRETTPRRSRQRSSDP